MRSTQPHLLLLITCEPFSFAVRKFCDNVMQSDAVENLILPLSRRVSVSLSQQEHEWLQGCADRAGVSTSWICRRALKEFIERNSSEEFQLPLHMNGGSRIQTDQVDDAGGNVIA